ncbi:DUF7537 family lipoprotein [Halomicrobium urmianum]|uniref:DUF7537 family lipoprotein n=1 Tax=Halomicrobium urmianum TaxID=1586233 RepID=UPI001CD98C45|nr:hypothetical protein [Halomicrobium urmianum]
MDVRPLVLALVAVTAGCGGLAGPDRETPTLTPAPVPEQGDGGGLVATGVAADGSIDAGRLARAHARAVENESYAFRSARGTTSTRANRTAPTSLQRTLSVEGPHSYHYWTDRRLARIDGRLRFLANYSEYADDGVGYVRYTTGAESGVTYRPISGATPNRFVSLATEPIRRHLALEDADVTAIRRDGQRYYEVEKARDQLVTGEPVENYTVTALIRPDGFVRSLSVSYVDPEQQRRAFRRFEYADVGETTVERPEWVSDARASIDSDGEDGPNATLGDGVTDGSDRRFAG